MDLQRAMHLKATGHITEAIAWLRKCVLLPGDRIPHRRYLAGLLEETKQYMDALEQWHAVRSLSSGDVEAETAIKRLRSLE